MVFNNFEAAKQFFIKGLQLLEAGSLEKAEVQFLESLKLAPDRTSILTNLSATQIKLKKFEDAKANAKKATSLDDGSVQAWLNLGVAELETLNPDQAIFALKKGVELKPDLIEALLLLAQIYDVNNDPVQAMQYFKEILRFFPQHFDSLSNVGSILNDLSQFQEALQYHEDALQINPEHCQALINSGLTLSSLKKYETALLKLNKAIKLDPNASDAWANKGIVHHQLGQYDEALGSYDEAIRLNPNHAESWSNRGNTLGKLERFNEALISFEQAIRLKPGYYQAWSNKGIIFHSLKLHDEATKSYTKAIEINPNYREAYYNRGMTYHVLKHYDKALVEFDKAIELSPNYAECFFEKSFIYIVFNEHKKAIANLEKAIEYNYEPRDHAEFVLSALNPGQYMRQMPVNFAVELFDSYADRFEKHLVGDLKYNSPEVMLKMLSGHLTKKLEILDIGCGTGLVGKLLKPHASKLVGVDLSKKMLEKAKLACDYDGLIEADIDQFLQGCDEKFDLVVAADVFIYIGELASIFQSLSRIIQKGGKFCFTVEKSEEEAYALSPKTLRYSQSKNYIEGLASQSNFAIRDCIEMAIRQEFEVDVAGYYFLLERV